jgi:hypothetical protein
VARGKEVKRILRKYGYPPDKQKNDADHPGANWAPAGFKDIPLVF